MDEEEGDDDGGCRDASIVTLADCEGLAVAPQRNQSIAWSDEHLVAAAVGHEVVLLSACWPQGPRAHVVHEARGPFCLGGQLDPEETRAEAVVDAWKRRVEVGREGKRTRKDKGEKDTTGKKSDGNEKDAKKTNRRQKATKSSEMEVEEESGPRIKTREYAEPVNTPHVAALSWSPLGMSNNGGCLLGTCTSDHAARIFQPSQGSKRRWQQVEDLTRRLEEALKDQNWAPCVQTKHCMHNWISGSRGNGGIEAKAPQCTRLAPDAVAPNPPLEPQPFEVGDKVEVLHRNMGKLSGWLAGEVADCTAGRVLVQFEAATGSGKKKEKHMEWFSCHNEEVHNPKAQSPVGANLFVRPRPPVKKVTCFDSGATVDANCSNSWCTGTILDAERDSHVKVLMHGSDKAVVVSSEALRCTYLWGRNGWVNVTESLLSDINCSSTRVLDGVSELALPKMLFANVDYATVGTLCSSLIVTCREYIQSPTSAKELRSWDDTTGSDALRKVSQLVRNTFGQVLDAAGVEADWIVDAVLEGLAGCTWPKEKTSIYEVGQCVTPYGQDQSLKSGNKSEKRELEPYSESIAQLIATHQPDFSSARAFKKSCVDCLVENFAYMRRNVPKVELPTYTRGKHLTGPDVKLFNNLKDVFIAKHTDKLLQFELDEKELTKLAKVAIRQHVIGADALLASAQNLQPLRSVRHATGMKTRLSGKPSSGKGVHKNMLQGPERSFEVDLSTLSRARKSVPAAFVRRFWELRSSMPADSLPQYKAGKHLYGIDAALTEKILHEMIQAFGSQLSTIGFHPKEILRLSKVLIRQCIIRGKNTSCTTDQELPSTGCFSKLPDEGDTSPTTLNKKQDRNKKSQPNAKFGDWTRMERWMAGISGPFLNGADHMVRRNWLSILTMSWSPMQVDKSQSNVVFSFLALGSKAGVITLWKIAGPKNFSLECTLPLQRCNLVGYIHMDDSWITTLEWGMSYLNGKTMLVLTAGSANGSLCVFTVPDIPQNPNALSLHPLSPVTTTLSYPDHLHVLCTSMHVFRKEVKIAVAKAPKCIYVFSGRMNETTHRMDTCCTHVVESNNSSLVTQIKWLPRPEGMFLVASFQNAEVKIWEMESWGFSELGAVQKRGLTKEESERRRVLSFEAQETDEDLQVLHVPDTGSFGIAFSPCFCYLGIIYAKSMRNLNLQQYERLEKGNVSFFKMWQSEKVSNRHMRVFGVEDPRQFAKDMIFRLVEELPRPSLWETKELLLQIGDADLVGEMVRKLEDQFLEFGEPLCQGTFDERPWRLLQVATFLRRLVPDIVPKDGHEVTSIFLVDNSNMLSQNEELLVQKHILAQYRTLPMDENNRIQLLLMADWVFLHALSMCAEVMDAAVSIYQAYGLEKPLKPTSIAPREQCQMCGSAWVGMEKFDYGYCPVCCVPQDELEATGTHGTGGEMLSLPRCMFYFKLCTALFLWECPCCQRYAQVLPPSEYHEEWTRGHLNFPTCIYCGVGLRALTMGNSVLQPGHC
mmetsp:Transcript_4212/g.26764  ORF Transcript_4212/g.26764 Transcript_4212/m.26764 type:complete len:1496 (+) Transcript_4212:69-4556(+)